MDELAFLKQKRLAQLQHHYQKQQNEQAVQQAELHQQIKMLESYVTQRLSKEAFERYMNIKTAHPERAVQVLTVLGQLINERKLEHVDDAEFKQLLQLINQETTRDIKIIRK
ncbi:TPA: hypothetical protein HA249_06085 [Candidatus Woesearchaeota archaeon]|nr:hypothetical protein [Candidatus Woesearchaeota archaeon]HII88190.1 hypothetical protein [Candidatus Woesearchaeota archaeon]